MISKKTGLTVLASIGGMVGGGCVGAVTGFIHANLTVVQALCAPVAYPLVSAGTAVVQKVFPTPGKSAAVGGVVGVCLIPLAPLALATASSAVPIHMVVGALVGGVSAGVKAHEHFNSKEQ